MKTATYHGITKATCMGCGKITTDISELELMNDLDNRCDDCEQRFTKWESTSGNSITCQMTDYKGNDYDFREEVK
jgi:DNA-directed RNA polymerase subunit RPC12/RpoP